MKNTIYEVFQEILKSDDPEKTAAKYATDTVFQFYARLIYRGFAWADGLDDILPEYIKEDVNIPVDFADQYLRSTFKRLYLFEASKELDVEQRNKLWQGHLESLHYTEAKFLMSIRNNEYYAEYAPVHKAIMGVFGIEMSELVAVKMLKIAYFASKQVNDILDEAFPEVVEVVINPVPSVEKVILSPGMLEGAKNLMDAINDVTEVKELGNIPDGVTTNDATPPDVAEAPKKRGRKPKEKTNE